jgi:hypothetical protein
MIKCKDKELFLKFLLNIKFLDLKSSLLILNTIVSKSNNMIYLDISQNVDMNKMKNSKDLKISENLT